MTKRFFFFISGVLFITASCLHAEGIQFLPASIHGFHPLYEHVRITSPLLEEHPDLFDIKTSQLKDTAIIDFEKRQITFVQYDVFAGFVVWQFHYSEFDDYFKSIERFALSSLWYKSSYDMEKQDQKKKGPPKLEFLMPVHYPAWARRVLGKEPPKLSIKGFQSLTVSYKNRQTESKSTLDEAKAKPSGGFGFDYDNMFTIQGSVGRLINIEIKTGKDKNADDFSFKDQMKKLKIEYKADPDSADQLEDEVIQEVVAGYTNFQMPGQGLAGYSGTHEGLFGVKVRSQWGPLALTTIVSRENAETQKKTIDPTGQSGTEVSIESGKYERNVYFFLDEQYIDKYVGNVNSVSGVDSLQIFKLEQYVPLDFNTQDYVYAAYGTKNSQTSDQTVVALFKRLKEKKDYEVFPKEGYIRFLQGTRIQRDDIIALYMVSENGSKKKGDLTPILTTTGQSAYTWLEVLKDRDSDVDNPARKLMWRNVYALPVDSKPEDFKIKVRYIQTTSKQIEKVQGTDEYFSYILGITNKEGNADVGNQKLFDFEEKYLIVPPYYDSIKKNYSNRPFENSRLGKYNQVDLFQSSIYDDDSVDDATSNFGIVTTGKSKQTSFNIGWGILPGSEKLVTKSGKVLDRNVDYLIDYEFGQVTLLSDRAKSGEIDVDYQQESLFMFESKRFLGAYGKLDLPNVGRESYIATSIMGQFTSSKDKIPRVGSEPFNRMLFDANLRLDFEPEWMTNLVNLLPLISTSSTSSATLDFEAAYSLVKPNQDNSGEAYIDNFQSSERSYPLGETQSLWNPASPSPEWKADSLYHPPSWRSYWYSPIVNSDRARRWEIWKLTKEDVENKNEYLTTLRIVAQPLPDKDTLLSKVKDVAADSIKVNPWAGIMTTLAASLQDRRKDRYLEFYVKNKAKIGDLYIDLGIVSEDISLDGGWPNGVADYEKDPTTTQQGEKKAKENLGLDRKSDTAEVYKFPDVNTVPPQWFRMSYGDTLLPDPKDPHLDNWKRYNTEHLGNKANANGTEGDEYQYMTTEDINGDGFRTREHFFRVKIDFADIHSSKWLDTAKTNAINMPDSGWYYIRIPLNQPDTLYDEKSGDPRWENIRFVRLLWTNFGSEKVMTRENTMEFTEMKFTGNQWQEVVKGDSNAVELNVTVLNSVDDQEYFRPQFIDSVDNERKVIKDYALRLEYAKLKAGEEALFMRDIPSYQQIDLSSYDEIRMYINEFESHIYKPNTFIETKNDLEIKAYAENFISFVFRFGNSDSSYYEYRLRNVVGHWRKNKDLRISLVQLAELKQSYHEANGNQLDSINIIDTLEDGSRLQVYSRTGDMPSFSNIKWMALGIVRDSGAVNDAAGIIWVNGLRVMGIKSLDGWAFRANLNTKWADFMDFSTNFSYDDADFRQMSEEPHANKEAKLGVGVNAQWMLSKFLPEKLGMNIPFGTGLSASLSRPKLRPGTDIILSEGGRRPDGIGEMGTDFADLLLNSHLSDNTTAAEHYEKSQSIKSWYTSYSKTTDSENPIVNFTADRITSSYNFNHDSTTQLEGLIPEADKLKLERKNFGDDHIDVKSRRTHNTSLKYDLSPRKPPPWTSWSPFSTVKSKDFPRYIKNYEFKLLPNRINFDLLDGQYSRQYEYRSIDDAEANKSVERKVENLGLSHGMQISYSPIAPLIETDFDITVNRNFDEALAKWGNWGTGNFIKDRVLELDPVWNKYYFTYAEKARSQNASLRVDPQFFEWLTHTGDYKVRYTHNPRTFNIDPNYLTTKVASEFGFSSNFRIRTFISSLAERFTKIKGLSKFCESMEKALDKISFTAINFTYGSSLDLNNDYLNTQYLSENGIYFYEYMKYQLGVKGRNLHDILTGNIDDDKAFGGMQSRQGSDEALYRNDKRKTNQNYTVGTSMALPKPLDIQLKPISLGWTRDYTIIPDSSIMDSTISFPDLRVGASSNVLERIPFVKANLKSLGMRSSYRFTKSTHKTHTSPTPGIPRLPIQSDITRAHAWEPLVSLDGLLKKWPINVDYGFSFSIDSTVVLKDKEPVDGSGKRTVAYGNTWNAQYTVAGKPDREMKILNRWTVPIKGETVISFDIAQKASTKSYQRPGSAPNTGQTKDEDWSFLIHPKVAYDFTDNVDGLLEYIFEKAYTDLDETTRTNNTFSLTVTIYFK